MRFLWSIEADAAFKELKKRFTTAPILVDASKEGIGVVLSQWSEKDGKMHPCTFLFRSLSKAERNYDVGN